MHASMFQRHTRRVESPAQIIQIPRHVDERNRVTPSRPILRRCLAGETFPITGNGRRPPGGRVDFGVGFDSGNHAYGAPVDLGHVGKDPP